MGLIAILLVLLGALPLIECSSTPGWDGKYAAHDRGNGTVDKSAPQYFSWPRYGY